MTLASRARTRLAAASCLAALACGAPTDASHSAPSVSLTPTAATLRVGERVSLTAAVLDGTGSTVRSIAITWASSNPAIASVDGTGAVTGLAVGDVTITATTSLGSASAALGVRGLPFGPFHLPVTLFDESAPQGFTGVLRNTTPDSILAILDSARQHHLRVTLRLVRGRQRFQNADSAFSLALWEQEVDRFRGIDFAPYVEDGTVIGHSLMDEPEDPTNWGGHPVPLSTLDSAAAYSKSIWPTMPAGAYSPPSLLERSSGYRYLDFAFAQYAVSKGDVAAWLQNEVAAAKRTGLALQLSLNALAGGANQGPMTAAQLAGAGSLLATEPYACALLMWKYDVDDPSYFAASDVVAATTAIGKLAAANPGRDCRP